MKTNAVSVHVTTPVSDDPGTDLRSLSERERMRVARFHNREGAAHWMACRAALRRILGQTLGLPPSHVPIVLTELGKPVLDSGFQHIHFNLTHCHDLTLVAISTSGPVGIDVEPLDRAPDLVECIETFCHPEEIRNLPKNPDALAPRLL
ncbi:MAG: 4'-phosphopantetheinyl transferase family protein, partial [Verrucomicrobiales bacterium]